MRRLNYIRLTKAVSVVAVVSRCRLALMHQFSYLAGLICLCVVSGCEPANPVGRAPGQAGTSSKSGPAETHSHSGNDVLNWQKREIDIEGYLITIGHHGDHFHGGDLIEPAAMITQNGEVVEDAVVRVSLVSTADEAVLAEEEKTIFEPATQSEPAHYAQCKMQIPIRTEKFLIRFRIELPGIKEPQVLDISASVH